MVITVSAANAENHTNPVLVMELAGEASGKVEIELFEDVAPNHVAQIKQLASSGKYDNVVFHRVIAGFMAQTGDVTFGKVDGGSIKYAGMGGSDLPNLDSEFSDIPFERGIVGMARSADPNSANSQFFIMFASAPHLTGQYTVIGKVVSGQEVVDVIKKGSPSANGSVVDPDYIKQATIR